MINNAAVVENAISKIDDFIEKNPGGQSVKNLLSYKDGIRNCWNEINNQNLSVVFIGKIGAGKTSAICRILDLQIHDASKGTFQDVLKTGAGRTTVCEVRIQNAAKVSIKINPLPPEEINRVVSNFADFVWVKAKQGVNDDEEGGNLLSEEVTRCIRNMLGLTIDKKKGEDGKFRSYDKALEFAKNCKTSDEVKEYMYQCLSLEKRTDIEMWPNQEESKDWKIWLREIFSKVNDGKLDRISIPQLITVCGPFKLQSHGVNWTVVDTRGLDSNVRRTDIREAIDSPTSIPVVCSSFVDAPDSDSRSLFELGVELGLKEKIGQDAILLVLDKNESDKVADIDEDVTDIDERRAFGRSVREDHIRNRLDNLFQIDPSICFFDSKQDDSKEFWSVLHAKHKSYVSRYIQRIENYSDAAGELINAEETKTLQFASSVKDIFQKWRDDADSIFPEWGNLALVTCAEFSKVHHRTLAASIERKGEFYNFNVYEFVNQVTRARAIKLCQKEQNKIKAKLRELGANNPDYVQQIRSLEQLVTQNFDKFAIKSGQLAELTWINNVKSNEKLWNSMSREWGKGSGYVARVSQLFSGWGKSDVSCDIHHAMIRTISSQWGRVLAKNSDAEY
jgi:hypothetical protein